MEQETGRRARQKQEAGSCSPQSEEARLLDAGQGAVQLQDETGMRADQHFYFNVHRVPKK